MKNNFYSVLFTARNFIDESTHEVEKKLFESIVKKLGFTYDNYNLENFKSVDLVSKSLTSDYYIIPKNLLTYYSDNHIFEEKSFDKKLKFISKADHLIIGVQTEKNEPLLSQTLQLLGEHVNSILTNDGSKTRYRVILILPALPLGGTVLYEKMLEPFCKSHRLIISDWNGKTLNTQNFESEFQNYIQESKLLDPKIKIEQKMIRKVGHFRRPTNNEPNSYKCHRYFYEGNECVKDVKDFICNVVKQNEYLEIIFFCPESKWLKEAIKYAIDDLDINDGIKVNGYDIEDKPQMNKLKKLSNAKCLFLLDLIDTGKTYQKGMSEIKGINPKLILDVITILITENPSNQDIRDSIKESILKVKQKSYDSPTVCPLCKLGLDYDSKHEETYHLLSSYNFWALAKEAGFEEEHEFPSYIREPIKSVPKFSNMLILNKAYLAFKTQLLLNQKGFRQLKNYNYISPDESGSKAYAKSLNSLYGIYTIVVPRIDLEILNSAVTIDIDFLEKNFRNKDWYQEIEKRDDDYIIFDEFTVSGGTFKDISKLLTILNRTVVAYLPLIKFTEKDDINDLPLLSLYSFDIFVSKPKLKAKIKSE